MGNTHFIRVTPKNFVISPKTIEKLKQIEPEKIMGSKNAIPIRTFESTGIGLNKIKMVNLSELRKNSIILFYFLY